MDRAFDFGSKGWEFESLRGRVQIEIQSAIEHSFVGEMRTHFANFGSKGWGFESLRARCLMILAVRSAGLAFEILMELQVREQLKTTQHEPLQGVSLAQGRALTKLNRELLL
jgi:hypothetical protein